MILSGETPVPQEVSEQKLTYEEVEGLLIELNQKGIFGTLRPELQGDRTFFDPDQGYIAEDDESPAGTVFDMYREALLEENPVATRNYYTEEERKNMIDALDPGSRKRMVLLSYYQISEETPWVEAVGAICGRQIHKSEDFPKHATIARVLEKIERLPQEGWLRRLGFKIKKDPQTERGFGGYITLQGPLESARKVLLAMTELGGYDEGSGWKRSAQVALKKSLENRINMDLDILGDDDEKRMVRVISFPVRQDGSIEVSLGGGGNRTKFSEMETAFEDAVARAVETDNQAKKGGEENG